MTKLITKAMKKSLLKDVDTSEVAKRNTKSFTAEKQQQASQNELKKKIRVAEQAKGAIAHKKALEKIDRMMAELEKNNLQKINKKTEEVRAKDYSEKGAVLLKKSILRNKEK